MLDLLFKDQWLVAVNKPGGLLVHRTREAPDTVTCMSLLRDQLGMWVYPAHRIDRGTSGVLLFSLDPESARHVAEAFRGREVTKSYLMVVRGFAPDETVIDYPLTDETSGVSNEAVTAIRTLERVELPFAVGRYPTARYSLVEAHPLTGRRHQIRRHLAHIRHPIVGDIVHGEGRHNRLFREEFGIGRLLLHAARLDIAHPVTGVPLSIQAPIPPELLALFRSLGWSHQDAPALPPQPPLPT